MGTGHMRCLNRGGNWNNGADNGVFYGNLNNDRSNVNDNIGGRSAFRLYSAFGGGSAPEWVMFYGT